VSCDWWALNAGMNSPKKPMTSLKSAELKIAVASALV
jgi:hypothetical protein